MDRLTTRFFGEGKILTGLLALVCADAGAIACTILLSLRIRFEDLPFSTVMLQQVRPHLLSLSIFVILYLATLSAFRLYRYAWRFASLEIIWSIISANTLGVIGLFVLQMLIDRTRFPLSVLFIIWLASIFFVGGMRILLRLMNISRNVGFAGLTGLRKDVRPKRVVIMGGGSDGVRLLSAIQEDLHEPYDVIGFLDDTPQKEGMYLRGVRVLGSFSHLYKLLADHAIDEVLIRLPNTADTDMRDYVLACRRQQIPVKIIPGMSDVLNGTAHSHLEEISVEDLLRRPPARIDLQGIGNYISGKRVMVTGAGGSIGSELCRQIAALAPTSLVLMGHGENSLHLIHQELVQTFPELANRLHVAIGSVSDDVRVDQIFRAHQPEVVYHAAAHKHVPLMEINVPEAVQNNVLGTQCVSDACGRYHIERMVLISTDKAVYPSSVMGATKWLCEEVVLGLKNIHPATKYLIVRFGNVLGSRGSVVPIFREQIDRGGPVTITHPEVTRYFMTIPEAVHLVLQAGAIGRSGELFVLNMGKPIKIADLARDMIRLCGFEPDVDIPITYTGLRPGEKLHERLASDDEIIEAATCDGLSVIHRQSNYTVAEIRSIVRRLQQLSSSESDERLLAYIGELIPAFADQRLLADTLSITEFV